MATKDYSGKAWMQAARARCGLAQCDVARALDVSPTTVKRWERPIKRYDGPPEFVRDFLQGLLDEHERRVDSMAERAAADALAHGRRAELTWYRRNDRHPAEDIGMPFTFTNAVTRDVAAWLEGQGIEVTFRYPGREERDL